MVVSLLSPRLNTRSILSKFVYISFQAADSGIDIELDKQMNIIEPKPHAGFFLPLYRIPCLPVS